MAKVKLGCRKVYRPKEKVDAMIEQISEISLEESLISSEAKSHALTGYSPKIRYSPRNKIG